MNDTALLRSLKQQLQQCAGFEGDEIASDRALALDYYFGRPRGDEVTGRAQVVSEDVSAMVEANLASMLDAFTSSNIVEFQSFGVEDEDQAQLESDTVSYVVMEQNNGFTELATAIKDALLLRNGFIKVWSEEKHYPELETYRNATPEAVAELLVRPNAEAKILKYDPETGDLRLRVVYTVRRLRVEAVDPFNFYYPREWSSFDLQEVPFCAERHVDTRSTLVELGFPKDKVKALKAYASASSAGTNELARNVGGAQQAPTRSTDASQDLIEWYEAYVLYDSDNDDIAERHRVCFVVDGRSTGNPTENDAILSDEEVTLVPYAAGAVFLAPHRLTGISLWDKLRQTQDISTALERARLDAINTAILNRVAVLDKAVSNADDLTNGRTNGVVTIKGSQVQDIRAAIMPFTVPDLSTGILANLQHQDKRRSELGGAALDMASGEMQLGDRVGSEGLDRAYSVSEQLAAMMTKFIAETLIKHTFKLAHATLRMNWDEPLPIKRNGKWFSPIPSEWPQRDCVYVKVGMSPGERTRKLGALDKMLQAQIALAQLGEVDTLVTSDGFYKTLMDWARVAEIPNPEQYFVDPSSPQAQQAAQRKAQMAQAQQEEQKNLMNKAVQLEQLRTATEKYKADQKTQYDYWAKTMDVQVAEAKIAGQATIEMIKAEDAAKVAERDDVEREDAAITP